MGTEGMSSTQAQSLSRPCSPPWGQAVGHPHGHSECPCHVPHCEDRRCVVQTDTETVQAVSPTVRTEGVSSTQSQRLSRTCPPPWGQRACRPQGDYGHPALSPQPRAGSWRPRGVWGSGSPPIFRRRHAAAWAEARSRHVGTRVNRPTAALRSSERVVLVAGSRLWWAPRSPHTERTTWARDLGARRKPGSVAESRRRVAESARAWQKASGGRLEAGQRAGGGAENRGRGGERRGVVKSLGGGEVGGWTESRGRGWGSGAGRRAPDRLGGGWTESRGAWRRARDCAWVGGLVAVLFSCLSRVLGWAGSHLGPAVLAEGSSQNCAW